LRLYLDRDTIERLNEHIDQSGYSRTEFFERAIDYFTGFSYKLPKAKSIEDYRKAVIELLREPESRRIKFTANEIIQKTGIPDKATWRRVLEVLTKPDRACKWRGIDRFGFGRGTTYCRSKKNAGFSW